MGFSISWVAFKSLSKADVLTRTGFRTTGVNSPDIPADRSPDASVLFAFCAFPTEWSTIFSADYRYAAAEGLGHLSDRATVLGVQAEEHMMFSAAAVFTNGREVWRLAHGPDRGRFDLRVSGTPPREYAPIRDKLVALQKQEGGRPFGTDHVYDIPVELAQAMTGYRHDEMSAWGWPRYEALEYVRSPT